MPDLAGEALRLELRREPRVERHEQVPVLGHLETGAPAGGELELVGGQGDAAGGDRPVPGHLPVPAAGGGNDSADVGAVARTDNGKQRVERAFDEVRVVGD